MQNLDRLYLLTHSAINDLNNAFQECRCSHSEGFILSVMVSVKNIQDLLLEQESFCSDVDPEEYCCAV